MEAPMMKRIMVLAGLALALSGCGEGAPKGRGVYMLLDTSGTYTVELEQAQRVINAVLARLDAGDSFAVASIDTGSFSEKDIVAKVTFDDRPSVANQQKRQFHEQVNTYVKGVRPSPYTDISGGLLQAIEYLNEKNPGEKTILIFSDLKEELAKGYKRDNLKLGLDKVNVVALNVTKLRSDNIDPREYLARVDHWQKRVEKGGGRFRVINDMDRLERILGG
jgi:VCBS repeat-containing protein